MADRTFATHQEAFEFACEQLDCSLQNGARVLGIVLAVNGRICSVKIAHPEDKTIPEGTLTELLARTDLKNVCFSAMLADKVPQVKAGDLVLYTTMPELADAGKPTVAGTVVAKVNPHYTRNGWQVFTNEPVAPANADGGPQEATPLDSPSTDSSPQV